MNATTGGLLVVDKPRGITSRDAVDRAQRWFGRRTRIGHAGTLDPLATGVLVLCLGSATRLVEYVQRMSKTYLCTICLGARSDSDDADGVITPSAGVIAADRSILVEALSGFVGTIDQVPPAYSAAKVEGRRAYALARRNEEVSLRPRPVVISNVDLLRYDYPEVQVEVRCGKGTYIRSLARDLGEKLGCGGFVRALRRTRIGPFKCEEAIGLEADSAVARARLLPAAWAVTELPRLVLAKPQRDRLRHGLTIAQPDELSVRDGEVAVFDEADNLAALVEADAAERRLRPVKVFGEATIS